MGVPRVGGVSEVHDEESVYDAAGGMPFFERLVAAFYEAVSVDPVLRPMYPDDDMAGAERRLTLFLAQYWGGPTTYMEERGHPRLRARHFPFTIGPDERDRWLWCMAGAVEECTEPGPVRDALMQYFVPVADMMRNDHLNGGQLHGGQSG